MNSKEFDKWANDMIKRVDYKKLFTYRLPPENWEVVICYNKRTGKTGIARCHPDDKFNLVWGKAIATARCLGIEVPKITVKKKLSEMKYGEKFIDESGRERYFIGKNPGKSGQYITLRIVDNHAMNCYDKTYEMVE